ncbi:MauE/DoxX family redox-associated membrane protein [Nonomuraea sp. KM88]|uniref:MauE/DoxX family redox-associated membrane protein n=1 Tax=Nonomuraea sp. KM88 TaxID=3457427 RepID=UPI003FCCF75E
MGEFLRVFPPVLLVVVFAVSSLAKVSGAEAFRGFAASVRALRLLPDRWAGTVTGTVAGTKAGAELVTAVLLLTPWRAAGLALAAAVLAVFAGVALVTRRRGLAVPCDCFGAGPARRLGGSSWSAVPGGLPIGNPHIVRNTVLAAVALSGLFGGADASAGAVGEGSPVRRP